MTSITLTVTGAKARATVCGPLTSGMVGIPVTIEYDDAWNGLTKNLVCRCGQWGPDRGETRAVPNIGETATVAHEVMKADRYLYLGIEGYSADGKLVMPTTWAACGKVQHGANTGVDPSVTPDLPFWARLQTEIDQIKKNAVTDAQIAAVASIKTVLGNIMTILKAQVEDADGTPQCYDMDVSGLFSQNDVLIAALGSSDDSSDTGGDDEETPGETEKALTDLSAAYSGGDVAVGTEPTDLTGIVVTAYYSDGSSETVTGYTLSGTIAEGSNTITVTYGGKTATFTVTGVAESSGASSVTTLSLCTNDGYLGTDGMTVRAQNFSFHSDSIDLSTIQSVTTKYRIAFVGYNYSPFLFYDADGSFLSGATGTASETTNAQYNYYELTESDIPAGAKYLKIVFIHASGDRDVNTLMTVYK